MNYQKIFILFIAIFIDFQHCYCQFLGGSADGLASLAVTPSSCSVVAVNPFSGGSGEGHSNTEILPSSCSVITVNPFSGGNGDGHSNFEILPSPCAVITVNPFSGGSGDGHSIIDVSSSPCAVITVNPFSGGSGDGHSDFDFSLSPCAVITVNPFSGGSGDGHSNFDISLSPCIVITVNPFSGGGADGHSDFKLVQFDPLPITLLFFNAKPANEKVYLIWGTTSELNNSFFTIERSIDAENWESIIKVNGAGNSNTLLHYNVTDYSPLQGLSYYRLRQTDYNGKYDFSNIVAVEFSKTQEEFIKIFPNPSSDLLTVLFNADLEELIITDLNGKLVKKISLKGEKKSITISVKEFPESMYFITIKNKRNEFFRYKLIKNK